MKSVRLIMKRFFYIFVCVLAIAFNGNAQQSNVIVNGLRVCEFYSREQMYEALGGEPDKVEESVEFKGFYDFHYGKDIFYWNNIKIRKVAVVSFCIECGKNSRHGDRIIFCIFYFDFS